MPSRHKLSSLKRRRALISIKPVSPRDTVTAVTGPRNKLIEIKKNRVAAATVR